MILNSSSQVFLLTPDGSDVEINVDAGGGLVLRELSK
jgi:hypothetical protein